ncbi:MAG: PID-CTERM protein-sorting domain-containing protein [Chitinophagaceae bacterium]|jgi:hypothetical protein
MARYISRILKLMMCWLFISMSQPLQAQDPGDPSSDDPAVPVDGGLSLLLAAGAAYAGQKLYRKETKEGRK